MFIEYEDNDVCVVYKEAGLAVQSGKAWQKDLVSILKEMHGGGYVGVVHRLDQPVEGLLTFALNREAAAELSRQAAGRKMRKIYRARVLLPTPRSLQMAQTARTRVQTLQDDLLRDTDTNTSRVVMPGTPGAKESELTWRTLSIAPDEKTAEVEIHLHTGRHHQIRVQMSHAGLPLEGDRKYGAEAAAAAEAQATQLKLCAATLTFRHPRDGRKMTFTCTPTWERNETDHPGE